VPPSLACASTVVAPGSSLMTKRCSLSMESVKLRAPESGSAGGTSMSMVSPVMS
jgi:hypothetical protein